MKVMLLAAGRGERMGDLTRSTPKPLLEVGGVSLIERQLRRLADAGFRDVVINLSYGAEQVRRHVQERRPRALEVQFIDEGAPPLETGGGIVNALPLLGNGPFLIVNADVITEYDISGLAHASAPRLVLVPNPPHHEQGDFGIDAEGYVTHEPPLHTFSGISILSAELFAGVEPGRRRLRPILDAAIDKRMLAAELYEGPWIDVGTPARLEEACKSVATGAGP